MNLSSLQRSVLTYIRETFPTPYRDGDEKNVRPRSKHQPPTRQAILEALKIGPELLDDSIEFLTAHDLARKVYRCGTSDYVEIQVAPGQAIRTPVAIDRPKDADPSDTRYGVYCFQITERGMDIIKGTQPQEMAGTIVAFSSYCHQDEKYRQRFEAHVSLLKRQGLIAVWDDHKITAGGDLDNNINEHLERAGIILLFVSPDFLKSDYCFNVELKRAIERHETGTARVIPIIVRPCDWHSAPFGKLKALPRDGKPITKWRPQDDAFLDVARGIREVVTGLNLGSRPKPSINAGTPTAGAGDDDKVSLSANLSIASHLIETIGCPSLELRLVCTSMRPAKIEKASLRIRGSHHITSFQEGFGRDLGYKPLQGKANRHDSLGFRFFPPSPPNSPNGFTVERDDACKLLLPGFGIPLPLLAGALPEDLFVEVEYIDGRKETVLEGNAVHTQVTGLNEMCETGQYAPKRKIPVAVNLDVLSKTPPDMTAVGVVNRNPIIFRRNGGTGDSPPVPSTDLEVFDDFPEIMVIGREALQGLCDEWLKTSIARQSRIAELTIGQKGSKLTISNLRIESPPDVQPGDHLLFPLDYLLHFLIERVVPPAEQKRLKALVDSKRFKGGLPTYQRFAVGPKRPLAVKCKNSACGEVLGTNLMGYHGQPPLTDIEPVVCPKCGVASTYEPADFFEFPVP